MVSRGIAREEPLTALGEHPKTEWAQYFTPPRIAQFMAGLFSLDGDGIRLLDPGAGKGSLSAAFLNLLRQRGDPASAIALTAYEIDPTLLPDLSNAIAKNSCGLPVTATILQEDFIESAVNCLQFRPHDRFTHAILNPPYKKIATQSRARRLLSQVGIETVNLYTGFVALSIALLEAGGQLVAITPRSFCNGPYYRPFRQLLLERCAIEHIHLFETRNRAFGEDGVLQENIVFKLTKGSVQKDVTISTSTDHLFGDYAEYNCPFAQIVSAGDQESFIHIPTNGYTAALSVEFPRQYSLTALGLEVSTGPVVDFRVRDYLRSTPEEGCAPLFYPAHFTAHSANWPIYPAKKPNAIAVRAETRHWFFPTGYYVVVRRFSSKEEKRRIVASLVTPDERYGPLLAFENHLNVFHANKSGLPEMVARGLVVYLNSAQVDQAFRRFSGHTQVNATDLRNMSYPGLETLLHLGHLSKDTQHSPDQLDHLVDALT